MTVDEEAARLLALREERLSDRTARALADRIVRYCRKAGMTTTEFSALAVDYRGFFGNLAQRHAVRARMHALASGFMDRWPDGVPAPMRAGVAAEQRDIVLRLRANASGLAPRAPVEASPPAIDAPVMRDPCFRCGVRGDIGCGCR
jgi:hypothetical protein